MFEQQVLIINVTLMVLDALCVVFAGFGAYYFAGIESRGLSVMGQNTFNMSVLLVMFINNYVMGMFNLYDERRLKARLNLVLAIVKSVVVDFLLLCGLTLFLWPEDYSRSFLVRFAILTLMLLLTERIIADIYINVIARRGFNARKVLILGDEAKAKLVLDALEQQLSWGHEVVGTLPISGQLGQSTSERLTLLEDLLKKTEIDEVIFAATANNPSDFDAYLDICCKMGITTKILPALWDPVKRPLRVEESQSIPFLTLHTNNLNALGLFYKRILDLTGGLIGSIVLLLLYPFIGLAIKLDSPGPVLFKQNRIGMNGRVFKLLKFRSMYVDAEERKKELAAINEMQGPMFKLEKDPRITRVGAFLRNTSLDEFPQFINVLKGEMSLVGTRPPTPEEVKQYDVCHRKRISAKPGITGLWQVSGRNKIRDFSEVVRLDTQYLDNWQFWDDIKILAKTVVVVLLRKGAF